MLVFVRWGRKIQGSAEYDLLFKSFPFENSLIWTSGSKVHFAYYLSEKLYLLKFYYNIDTGKYHESDSKYLHGKSVNTAIR